MCKPPRRCPTKRPAAPAPTLSVDDARRELARHERAQAILDEEERSTNLPHAWISPLSVPGLKKKIVARGLSRARAALAEAEVFALLNRLGAEAAHEKATPPG